LHFFLLPSILTGFVQRIEYKFDKCALFTITHALQIYQLHAVTHTKATHYLQRIQIDTTSEVVGNLLHFSSLVT
jgi:ethanolamine utilization protein EutP (predicted NTPase)